jgi:ATP-binding cassette, subfamily B, multidrug efflux pump
VLMMAHFTAGAMLHPGEIFAFFSLINMFFRPLREMAEEFNTFQSAMAAMERVRALLAESEPLHSPLGALQKALPTTALGVEFKNVHFAYQLEKPVLKGLNLNILPEQTVALVGNTGAGKSTMIHLINRLYDVQDGSVCVGGEDLRHLKLEELRAAVATIPQDVMLFSGSVLDNIRLFDQAISQERIQEAILGLGLEEFITQLPQGLATELGEMGTSLSEGEKQLIAFARAWVKSPRVLILDEATANVDSRTEKQLGAALLKLKKGRTTIVIAHRLSTIQSADKICVLHQGQLAEEGSHDELLRQRSLYYKLYRRQSLSLQVEGNLPLMTQGSSP